MYIAFSCGTLGGEHLIELISFTLRCCDLLLLSLWIKLSSVLLRLSKTVYKSPLQFHKN